MRSQLIPTNLDTVTVYIDWCGTVICAVLMSHIIIISWVRRHIKMTLSISSKRKNKLSNQSYTRQKLEYTKHIHSKAIYKLGNNNI